jgi:endonuclease/exonuclease/phosphatase family metal-dependent hydrolase
MKLTSFNIQYGFGADGIYSLNRIADTIRDRDLIAVQEVDRHWSRTNHDDQPAILTALLPDHHMVYAPAFDMALPNNRTKRRQFGPLILSRWPILWSRTWPLPKRRMLDPINTQTAALEAVIAHPSGPIKLINIHLAHVGVEERLDQIAFLKQVLGNPATEGGPWSGTDDEPQRNWTEGETEPPNPTRAIWAGDFNMEPGSAEYRALLGQTPYHPGARYADGLIDPAAGLGLHTHVKEIAGETRRRQLDHIFLTPDLAPMITKVWADTTNSGSDHVPLHLDLAL